MRSGFGDLPAEVARVIREAVCLIDDVDVGQRLSPLRGAEPLPSLLERCEQLCSEAARASPEPVRTIHHFACTGGTLISKCLATLPNVYLLSEVDPLSELAHGSKSRFYPTDLIGLVRLGTRPPDDHVCIEIFLRGLSAIYEDARKKGLRLILRDHSHSHFCVGPSVRSRPTLRQIVGDHYPLRALVTVRHPLDSYLSLLENGWAEFTPNNLDEYARRYQEFLAHHEGVETIRYEDLIEDPENVVLSICRTLALPYNENFMGSFSAITLSGDSGRSGRSIAARARRSIPRSVQEDSRSSMVYAELCEQLGYETQVI